ncbi:MAG: hypothetical protein WD512_00700 [Candidatus Paceibacterota bacterium]
MSIGNTKTDGNKGNNFPFQLKVLQGLQCTCDELKAIGLDTEAIEAILTSIASDIAGLATEATLQTVETNTTGVVRTPNLLRINDSNDLAAFAPLYSVSVANAGSADGTVLGGILRPGEVVNFSADALNNFFSSFILDATGTEFIITYIN